MQELTLEDYNLLKQEGYTDEQIQKAMLELEKEELNNSYVSSQKNSKNENFGKLSLFTGKYEDDLVKWQLELNDLLERIEHILRGDVPTFKDGKMIWEKNPNPEKNPLNEFGVQLIMQILAMYVNKHIILGDYTQEEINKIVLDFGKKLNDLIFMKDYEIGLNTEEKRKEYEMLVGVIVDEVYASYKRALDGAEKRSLREMVQISHTFTQNTETPEKKERSILNPMRYIRGKYVV